MQNLMPIRDAMNAQVEASQPSMDAPNTCEQCQIEDCNTRVNELFENQHIWSTQL
jgi:hypothetical protein